MMMPEITRKTLDARERTGRFIAVSVEAGRFRVEEIFPKGDTCDIVPLSDRVPAADIPALLDALEAT